MSERDDVLRSFEKAIRQLPQVETWPADDAAIRAKLDGKPYRKDGVIHNEVIIEPTHWEPLGDKAAASAALTRLAEDWGCEITERGGTFSIRRLGVGDTKTAG